MNRCFKQVVKTKTLFAILGSLFLGPGIAQSQTLDELHKSALKEGGTLNFYATLAQINAARILPVEKRFRASKSSCRCNFENWLLARLTESRGGKLGDFFTVPLENVTSYDQSCCSTHSPESPICCRNEGNVWVVGSSIYHLPLGNRAG